MLHVVTIASNGIPQRCGPVIQGLLVRTNLVPGLVGLRGAIVRQRSFVYGPIRHSHNSPTLPEEIFRRLPLWEHVDQTASPSRMRGQSSIVARPTACDPLQSIDSAQTRRSPVGKRTFNAID
jgi:hypothetical protein